MDKLSANRATMIAIFRDACGTGSTFEIDWMDERQPDESEANTVLSVAAIKLLTGDDVTDGDIDRVRAAVREMQGRA